MKILTEAILRAACLLVPRSIRAEWLAEWRAEVWYVRERSQRNATMFCLGAFSDAVCMFRSIPRNGTLLDAPATCIVALGVLAVLGVIQVGSLPGGVSPRFGLERDKDAGLVALWRDGHPGVQVSAYAALKKSNTPLLTSSALYQRPRQMHVAGVGEMALAPASTSLLDVLAIETPAGSGTGDVVVLTRAALRRHSGASAIGAEAGTILHVAGHPTRVAGIVPDYAGPFAREIDGWLVSDELLEEDAKAYVLARVAPAHQKGRLRLPFRLIALPIASAFEQTVANFLLMTLLAVILLPVANSLSFADLPRQINRPSWFFLLKLCLVLVMAYCASANLSFARTSQAGSPILVHVYLLAYILGLRWVISDQRSRCPVCLGRLGNPASIGEGSRIFLDRSITELVCARGHGLMHIPETPTSWFAVQRWSPLDTSWQSLFTR